MKRPPPGGLLLQTSDDFAACACGCVADRRNIRLVVLWRAAREYRRSGDERVGACGGDLGGVVRRDPAVNLYIDRASRAHGADGGDLLKYGRDEGLTAEAGIDRHHQNDVSQIEHVLDDVRGRCWIERNAGLLAERADSLQRAMQMG